MRNEVTAQDIIRKNQNYHGNMQLTRSINKECIKLQKKIIKDKYSLKEDVILRFFVNLYKGYRSFQTLLFEEKTYIDSTVIARRIIELFIRFEYIAKYDLYKEYDKYKHVEAASMFRAMLEAYSVEIASESDWWSNRREIVKRNKEVKNELSREKYRQYGFNEKGEFPKIDEMAHRTNLTFLYKISYGLWSNSVHGSSLIESVLKDSNNGQVLYCFEKDSDAIGDQMYLRVLQTVNYCVCSFLKRMINLLDLDESSFKEFMRIHYWFFYYDSYTGRLSTNHDFANSMIRVFSEEEIEDIKFDDINDKKYFNTQKEDFNKKKNNQYYSLEDLIKSKEDELESLSNRY
ncbi:hypothetical protein DFP93_103182 [Aneurinibacillus soli]|uniref:Uncharacterized protein n=1 Tax=Aneurinibacillus soli TaxID=1500254 RepID=A0A0U4WKH7_9BACL|nr:DUF5677 domain-containing protein [Aneurinibacillus soli]PYE62970.1 hypothetical protein DFP93_103182 [Aneurinibacillus soli]BAU28971.1 hypothetical protein CB4_03148 [Aneurinibacillus soli]